MTLPWVRLDTKLPGDEAILELVGLKRWQAVSCYVLGLTYVGAQESDGHIPRAALGLFHADRKVAAQLVEVGLWAETEGGYFVRSWAKYQPDSSYRDNFRRMVCARWMKEGKPCSCGTHS